MKLPLLDLNTPDGTPVSWPELWQRHNVLLLFAHPDCPTCRRVLDDWAARKDELAAENARPVAVFSADPGRTPEGVLVLLDPEGRLARRLGVRPGTVVAADRFFEVMGQDDVHRLGPDASVVDAFDWVKLAERECPECGVATW